MKKVILITGGTGFIGRNLIPLLEKKYEIKILSREVDGEKIVKGDLVNYDSVKDVTKNVDEVIHLAYSKNYPENILMTENLIKACKEEEVKKIILLSSMSAKRSYPDDYGKNKLEIEKIIKNSGINYTILRPSIVYGKGSKSFDFIIEKIKKLPFIPIIGNGKYAISPVYIDDVICMIDKCVNNKKTDKKEYDLPGGESIWFRDLIKELKKEINTSKKEINIPIGICKIVARISPKVISMENIKNLTEDSKADIEIARKDLGYNPVKFSEGIKNGLI
ncbi:MAG: NAD(P)-dependent oxidoreductase [Candidatus Nanoarchaeia archaeon]|nr:NAD(P)-dependent oxidoreductase [Candidatus Nanoarchaeia archaeon]MDD5358156.1 NAD(P)-dependent oxidoreductase [Candidatus Nanoarchaeia archaeon]MDD5589343.1 NAD(P)-dependent oxidoreductase [Candidatus Nanoarchaeia archaeon]